MTQIKSFVKVVAANTWLEEMGNKVKVISIACDECSLFIAYEILEQ